jgi:hypothetical protein
MGLMAAGIEEQDQGRHTMKSKPDLLLAALIASAMAASILLAGCEPEISQTSTPSETPIPFPSPNPTLLAAAAPTSTVPSTATVPEMPATPTPLLPVQPTLLPNAADCKPDATFVTDVTLPDNTNLTAGVSFTKTWRLKNTGTCNWGAGYRWSFLAGELMNAPAAVVVPPTPAGASVDISVIMTAPTTLGIHTGFWRMQTPDGTRFGDHPYVRITIGPSSSGPAAPSGPGGCVPNADFVSDVTVPDNTLFQPGSRFTKTWRIKNSGTCNWDSTYQLAFMTGSSLGGPASTTVLPTAVGATVDISVNLTAPSQPGAYSGTWGMETPGGTPFGAPAWVRIVVPGAGSSAPLLPNQPLPPGISGVTAHSRQIFLAGRQMGNQASIFAKVGDSLTATPYFLRGFGNGQAVLGNYGSLQPSIVFFSTQVPDGSNSFTKVSIAATPSWDSFNVLDPSRASPPCGDSPDICEYKAIKPSVAIILIGTNDSQGDLNSGTYQGNLQTLVGTAIAMGIIPVLTTLPWNKFRDAQAYNAVIISVARSNDIPLMDYWSLMEPLPNHGIGDDGVHPSLCPDGNPTNLSATNLQYGFTVHNLLALQMLDVLRRQVLY